MTVRLGAVLTGILLLTCLTPVLHADNTGTVTLLPHVEGIKNSRPFESLSSCLLKMDNDTVAGYSSGYVNGDRTVTLFDAGDCSVPTYPFQIKSISFALIGLEGYHWPLTLDIVIFDAITDGAGCSYPGKEIYRFTAICDSAKFFAPRIGEVKFPVPGCVRRRFFVGVEYTDTHGGPYPSLVFDNNSSPERCVNWQYAGGQWNEWYDYWVTIPGYPVIWVQGTSDAALVCPDSDGDLLFDRYDNCPCAYNPDQADADADGVGNACEDCCTGATGNVNNDLEGKVNLADLTFLIDYVYISGNPPCCKAAANTSGDVEGKVNLADVTALIDHIYIKKTPLPACQ